MKHTLRSLRPVLLALLAAPGLAAQSAVPVVSARDEAVVLSPFEVKEAANTGYAAAQTLAGTRLASNIEDVAAQVTVMTAEFLQDIAATTLDEAMLYSLNVENRQEYNNNPDGDGLRGHENLTGAQRVRGLGDAANTRDFFTTFFAHDTYNSERFTFNSGPNAILYGLGSPGGIIDQSLKRARFRNTAQIMARFDSYDGYRSQLDVNRAVVPGIFALRASVLYDHAESWKKPSRDLQRRHYVTATLQPLKTTTLRFSIEGIRRDAAIPRNTLTRDFVTPYLAWRKQRMQQLNITDSLDPRLYWAPNSVLNTGEAPFATGAGTPFALNSNSFPLLMTGRLSPDTPAASLLNRVTGAVSATNPIASAMRSRGPHEDKLAPDNYTYGYSLTDPSIVPYDVNLGGLGSDNHQKGAIYNAVLEQQFTRDFVVEASFQHEQYNQLFVDWMRGLDQNIQIDVNRYLPNVAAGGRPVLNPNRGKYFVENARGRSNLRTGDSDQVRVTASYRLDFTRFTGWRHWLGRHNFAGLIDHSEAIARNQNARESIYNDRPETPFNIGSGRNAHSVTKRAYLDEAGGRQYFDINSDVTRLYHQDYGTSRNLDVEMNPTDIYKGLWAVGSVDHTRTRGQVLALQSQFWQDRIVTTYGRRKDHYLSKTTTTPLVDPVSPAATRPWYWDHSVDVQQVAAASLEGPVDINQTGQQETRGIVVKPLRFLAVHYNESSNFAAGAPRLDPNGGYQETSSGQGKDYGFSVNLPNNRLGLKINWYESSQNATGSQDFGGINNQVRIVEERCERIAAANPAIGFKESLTWDGANDWRNSPVLSDLQSKGMEITLVANPLRNWRVSVSAAKTKAVETNIAGTWIAYVAARTPEWAKCYNESITDSGDVNFGDRTVKQFIDDQIGFPLTTASLVSGKPSDAVRKWRVNVVSSYDCTTGFLRNAGVGGALRWRDQAAIGLPMIPGPGGTRIQDIYNPYFDNGLVDFDGWVSYRTKLWSDKVRVRFQLNVRNLFDSRDLLPQKADTTGVNRLFTSQPPRQFIFTTTFDL